MTELPENGKAEMDVPENAPSNCPGTQSESAGKTAACAGCPNQQICATAPKGPDPDLALVAERMKGISHKLLVLSGKGGVGKSTFAAQLAFALAAREHQVGLLDVDICGPSIPRMLGLEGEEVHQSSLGWSPVYVDDNLGVMSIGFMLPNPNEAVIWRGPRKNGLIKQFLKDVNWGELDFLVVDTPPGTSDEHISIAQYLAAAADVDGAIIITTPQEVSLIDVRKEISFCRKVGLRVLGVVENMSSLRVPVSQLQFLLRTGGKPDEGKRKGNVNEVDITEKILGLLAKNEGFKVDEILASVEVFHVSTGGAEAMAREMGVPFLGRIPMDPSLSKAAEQGRPFSAVAAATHATVAMAPPSLIPLQNIIEKILGVLDVSQTLL